MDCVNYSSCSRSSMLRLATWVIWFRLVSYFWINLNMGVCPQLVYSETILFMHAWHFSPPQVGASSHPRRQHILNMFFRWSLCANNSQLIWKFAWHSNTTYPKHLPLDFIVGHVLVGVNPCGRCVIAALLSQIPKLCKNQKIIVSRCVSRFE